MPKNKQSDLIARVKTPNKTGGGYSVLVNYQSFLSNIFSLAPQLFLLIKYRQHRLLQVSFIV